MSLTELSTEETKFFESKGESPPEEVTNPEPVVETPVAKPETDDKQVPLAALHEARQIQKELREELKRAREEAKASSEKAEKYSTRFEQFLAERTKEAAPKYEDDPLGSLKYENERLQKQLEELNSGVQKTQEEWGKSQQYQNFAQQVVSQEAVYKQSVPDYDQAIAHLKEVRLQDFADLGFSREDALLALQNEIYGLAQAAMQKGKNAAEVAYKMSQRYGYKPNTDEKKLETLAKGQEASKSLAGGKADVAIGLDALAQLDEEQFDALIKDDKAWRKLGGR
jgi:hypothetical protein